MRFREDGYGRDTNDSQKWFTHPKRDKTEREARRNEDTKYQPPKENREHRAKSRGNDKPKDEALEKSRMCEVHEKGIKPLCDNQTESDSKCDAKSWSHEDKASKETKERDTKNVNSHI